MIFKDVAESDEDSIKELVETLLHAFKDGDIEPYLAWESLIVVQVIMMFAAAEDETNAWKMLSLTERRLRDVFGDYLKNFKGWKQ